MNTSLGTADVRRFRSTIVRRLGLRFDDGKLAFLDEVLDRRSNARRMAVESYLDALENELDSEDELRALAVELTVGETYFFRHAEQFNALCETVLPERAAAKARSGTLRLLSVGCASGEEPYTLAILLQERGFAARFEVELLAMDLNPESLQKARRGVYSAWSLRETPPSVRARWFEAVDQKFRVTSAVRRAVQFHEHNLVRTSDLLLPDRYDVIFCRNVLMYFTPEHASAIVQRLARALTPGGFLFLGHAETLRDVSHGLTLRHTHETFYYQRENVRPETDGDVTPVPASVERPASAPANEWVGNWLEAVQSSSERIRKLSDAQPPPLAPGPPAALTALMARSDLRRPLELLASERFSEALASLPQSPATVATDATALLLRAALLTHQGDLAPAEAACRQLLELDELNAGAHYLLALCFERKEELSLAAEHARTAVYLDAGFAMPHLHLGLMARRRRDAQLARRELSQALWLFEREEPARLLLFGGGFTRAALLNLCRSELENLRGAT